MHPILFRIPLPNRPLKIWWALVAVAVLAAIYAAYSQRKAARDGMLGGLVVALAAGVAAYVFRNATPWEPGKLPIFSYGVMLGLSLVVGWYITLPLAERDGLPRETMANCYVVTALAAFAGSRVLYILTNMGEFTGVDAHGVEHHFLSEVLALRNGGLVAYGGFIGGYLGSWALLSRDKIKLLPWADVAVPSLASGLFITRIGCYLYGCDFGTRLSEQAPGWLQKLGTFPHWRDIPDAGGGSPAWLQQEKDPHLLTEITKLDHALPVHPTQIYESLLGLALLGALLWQRKHQKFRGQIFFTFVFLYGYGRFLLEIVRADDQRGFYGPELEPHILYPASLVLLGLGFVFGVSLGIENLRVRLVARALAFVPPIFAYLVLVPKEFGDTHLVQLSTSQLIGLGSALVVAYFYAQYWEAARKKPKAAMGPESLGEGVAALLGVVKADEPKKKVEEAEEEDDNAEEDAPTDAPKEA